MQEKITIKNTHGSILITMLVITFIFIILAGGLMGILVQQKKMYIQKKAGLLALQIAEAGVNYYKWHLDNFPDDYADGTGQTGCNPCGPYVHNYDDPGGNTIGAFELSIYPPPINSTVVKIQSTGWTIEKPNTKRILGVRYGRPSWVRYAAMANANIRFGTGTSVNGPLHSNGGIRFDGIAYNEVTSGQETYNDTDSDACTVSSWGVHTCVAPADPTPPTTPPLRSDIFRAGRRYPVASIDFNAVSQDLNQLQQSAGLYINQTNREGVHIQFLGNNLQYRTVRTTSSCGSTPTGAIVQYQGNWTTSDIPTNGIIFVEDNVWLDGTLNSGKYVTVVAAKEPLTTGSANVWINNDLQYAVKDDTVALGVIAQNNINIGLYSDDTLEVNGALLAQKGRVGRYYYPSSCSSTYYERTTINVYGAIASNQRYGFSWICGGVWCSGYNNRNIAFDSHLTYSPPPSYPSTGEYAFVSWEELVPGETI